MREMTACSNADRHIRFCYHNAVSFGKLASDIALIKTLANTFGLSRRMK
jgi:hypothetical protein